MRTQTRNNDEINTTVRQIRVRLRQAGLLAVPGPGKVIESTKGKERQARISAREIMRRHDAENGSRK